MTKPIFFYIQYPRSWCVRAIMSHLTSERENTLAAEIQIAIEVTPAMNNTFLCVLSMGLFRGNGTMWLAERLTAFTLAAHKLSIYCIFL